MALFVAIFVFVAQFLHQLRYLPVFIRFIAFQQFQRSVLDVFAANSQLAFPGSLSRLSGHMAGGSSAVNINGNLHRLRFKLGGFADLKPQELVHPDEIFKVLAFDFRRPE